MRIVNSGANRRRRYAWKFAKTLMALSLCSVSLTKRNAPSPSSSWPSFDWRYAARRSAIACFSRLSRRFTTERYTKNPTISAISSPSTTSIQTISGVTSALGSGWNSGNAAVSTIWRISASYSSGISSAPV